MRRYAVRIKPVPKLTKTGINNVDKMVFATPGFRKNTPDKKIAETAKTIQASELLINTENTLPERVRKIGMNPAENKAKIGDFKIK
jgi:hypothetical protein